MTRSIIKTLALLAVVAAFTGTKALATGKWHPPSCVDCKEIELPKCYWTAEFKVEYKGQKYYGKIFYTDENIKSSGYSLIAIDESRFLGTKTGLLGVEFNFKGKTFDQCDDVAYDKTPLLKFKDGKLVGLQFAFKKDRDLYSITLDKFYKNLKKEGYVKYYTPVYNCDDCDIIPTPAAASAGFALLAPLALRRRRRHAA